MLKGKKVRIRLKRYFAEQKQSVFVGTVLNSTENWITINGKGIVFLKGRTHPLDIDKESRVLMIPRESIANVRLLPDNFNMTKIVTERQGLRIFIKVKDAPDAAIGEDGGD